MSGVKLTLRQREALASMEARGTASAYSLRAGLSTLRALKSKGLATSVGGLGSMAFPRTSIDWTITEAGRALLSRIRGEGE